MQDYHTPVWYSDHQPRQQDRFKSVQCTVQ